MTTVVHCKGNKTDDDGYTYIGRPSKWGNRHPVGFLCPICRVVHSREEAIKEFKKDLANDEKLLGALHELKGKELGCWCKPKACHGDVLKELCEYLYKE